MAMKPLKFLLTPLREGRRNEQRKQSRRIKFLLTPLREGRHDGPAECLSRWLDFYSRPCGRGDEIAGKGVAGPQDFYSRPCGRGDSNFPQVRHEVLRQIAER